MKIHHVAITVNNLDESIHFYETYFGFTVSKKFQKEKMAAHAAFLSLRGFHIELWQFSTMKENQDSLRDIKVRGIRHLAFAVSDVGATFKEFREKGLHVTEPKIGASGHKFCFTRDPNGVALELYEE